MRFAAVTAVLILLVASATPSAAATTNKLIAVLPLDVTHAKQKLDVDAQASLEEMLRDVATEHLAPRGWTVLATQNMLQTLRDNGVDPTKCGEEDCQVSTARELKAAKFISGAVQYVEGEFTASIRLIDTETGQILASARLEGDSVKALRKAFEKKADDFFVQGRMIAAGAAPAVTATPVAPLPNVDLSGPRVKKSNVSAVVGTLTVIAKPRDLVRLDIEDPEGHKLSSAAPYENKAAIPGTWKIVARASGYGDEQQTVVVAADDVTVARFELLEVGGLSIQGTPQGAAVTVSGPNGFHDEGGLPWEATGLHAGSYQISVSRPGYEDESRTVEVKPGATATTEISLQKSKEPEREVSRPTPRAPEPRRKSSQEGKLGVGLSGGMLKNGDFMLGKVGAIVEYRMLKNLSYFADASLTFPTDLFDEGFSYSVGVRWYVIEGLSLGVMWEGWTGSVSSRVLDSVSGSLGIAGSEVGYTLGFGPFTVGVFGRAGYLAVATVGDVESTATGVDRLAIGFVATGSYNF